MLAIRKSSSIFLYFLILIFHDSFRILDIHGVDRAKLGLGDVDVNVDENFAR